MQTIHAAEAIPQSLLGRHGDIAPTCWCGQDLEYVAANSLPSLWSGRLPPFRASR